jgi:hypothetical protein
MKQETILVILAFLAANLISSWYCIDLTDRVIEFATGVAVFLFAFFYYKKSDRSSSAFRESLKEAVLAWMLFFILSFTGTYNMIQELTGIGMLNPDGMCPSMMGVGIHTIVFSLLYARLSAH